MNLSIATPTQGRQRERGVRQNICSYIYIEARRSVSHNHIIVEWDVLLEKKSHARVRREENTGLTDGDNGTFALTACRRSNMDISLDR